MNGKSPLWAVCFLLDLRVFGVEAHCSDTGQEGTGHNYVHKPCSVGWGRTVLRANQTPQNLCPLNPPSPLHQHPGVPWQRFRQSFLKVETS